MMKMKLSRVNAAILSLVGVFLLALSLAAAALVWNSRQTALTETQAQAERFVSGAEVALNRSLLGVDVLLASMDELLGLSTLTAAQIVPQAASRLMHGAIQQNMMIRHVALIDTQARVLASSDFSGAALTVKLPAGFLEGVLSQPISAMQLSQPTLSFSSSEQVLYLARHIQLRDGTKVLVSAEIQIPVLTSILTQGVNINGLEVTLERSNGQLLASEPPQGQLFNPVFALPADTLQAASFMPARLSGVPALVLAHPTLYPNMLIAASIPLDAALADWRSERRFILGATLLFALMILAAGIFAFWYLDRLTQARLNLAQSKTTLDQALESMVSGFMLLDARNQILTWNRRLIELYPWLKDMLTPMMPFDSMLEMAISQTQPHMNEVQRQDWIQRRKALMQRAQGSHEQKLPNGKIIQITERRTPTGGMVIVYQDVTELHAATAEIEHMAFYDALTNLPNRRLLLNRLQQACASSTNSGRIGALLCLDIDQFKILNDTQGHDTGDLLLRVVAQRLSACVRTHDTVARLGGDEFVVMLEDLSDQVHEAASLTRTIADNILDQLGHPYQLGLHTHNSTASVGVVLFGPTNLDATDLLKQADIAMYQAKSDGRNCMCFFDPYMQATITARAQLETDLRTALQAKQFELYYQPQVDQEGRILGAEALIRWRHPLRGLVPPFEFIPAAEESDLIIHIGQWVLRTACQQLAVWQGTAHGAALKLAVNVSARQFRQPNFVAEVTAVLQDTGAPAHQLKLELTESLVLDDVADTITKMKELKVLGVQFSVDDFGTGHSSLAYLTSLPLDQLKIDQSFVRNIGLHATDGVIVQTIIGMARNLALDVIAEGVETRSQQAFLALHGCARYQGYLFGKPTPLAEFEALLGTVLPCTPNLPLPQPCY
jgi:diguanylate cyclase (GGDEF)-like protein